MTGLASLLILTCVALLGPSPVAAYFGLTGKEPILSLILDEEDNHTAARERTHRGKVAGPKICDLKLKLRGRQRKMCERGHGIAESLIEAVRMSVIECRYQFQFDRWNCSLGQHRLNLLKKGFKESAFLYAISSAGVVHTMARACSQGQTDLCTCDESINRTREAWLWGGCGDNIYFAQKFTRRFIRAKRLGKDLRANVDKHNSKAGIKAVRDNMRTTCKCHGVSGSCSARTCWRQLAPFHKVGSILKSKYNRAVKVASSTNKAAGKLQFVTNRKGTARPHPRSGALVFVDSSPNFCQRSNFSLGTRGRLCQKEKNCHTICCGRGHNVQSKMVSKPCHCQVIWCCYVKCKKCDTLQEIYLCK